MLRRSAVSFSPRAVVRACATVAALTLTGCTDGGEHPPTVSTADTARTTIRCPPIAGLTPEGDHAASAVVVTGMTCAEAEALLRGMGGRLGPDGPARAEAGGFTCVRAGAPAQGQDAASYECSSRSRKVTFDRL